MSWQAFEDADPELAAVGRERLHGRVAYLATMRADGTPRAHPVTPIIGDGHLYLFMEPSSPKGRDLERGSGYALHCGVEDNGGGDGEFAVTGRGMRIDDPGRRSRAAALATFQPAARYVLYELNVETVLSTVYGDGGARRRRWRAGTAIV